MNMVMLGQSPIIIRKNIKNPDTPCAYMNKVIADFVIGFFFLPALVFTLVRLFQLCKFRDHCGSIHKNSPEKEYGKSWGCNGQS